MRIRRFVVATVLTSAFALSGAAFGQADYVKGRAAYYSDELKGNEMACGAKYYPTKMVAAHRKLPCGTRLRVKNLANDKVVKVTVRDRGPHDDDFVLDLSRRAARKLGYISKGSTKVKAKVLGD
ncbi:MAG: septal ring lytic transglycosylase RlpA family protein [Actinomycetota bacterium]